jgi:GT2 family glycosyltransferase
MSPLKFHALPSKIKLKIPVIHKLAVIIVNYNVEHFLEQCLNSVRTALNNINAEVIIVDNNSIDSSVEMIKSKFPEYTIIENKCNAGFSKANNQAINVSSSEYILLLNPDTVVEEDSFLKVLKFMDEHPNAGGLGVRMVDGKGCFLPESKRGLPTPSVAFYKIFGLSKLFPSSKTFGQYHAGHLNEFEINETQILSGAFMLMRRKALEKVGLLDEAFFMYGEDIDLSWRIAKGGYKNYYFPETTIIHYKGESTKKSSVNYVFVFYNAMVIFARKHFSQQNARLFTLVIHIAIYLRASLAILSRFVKRITLPLIDVTILFFGLFAMTYQWKKIHIEFPENVLRIAIPGYLISWLTGIFLNGGSKFSFNLLKIVKGVLFSTLFILIIYALLPKEWQFSRLFIITGAFWIIFYFVLSRTYLHFAIGKRFNLFPSKLKRFAVVGDLEEVDRVKEIIRQSGTNSNVIFKVSPNEKRTNDFVGNLSQLDQIIHIHDIDEIVFCAKNIAAGEIIKWMTRIPSEHIDFKIAQPDSLSLIGSNSIDTAGDHYVLNVNSIGIKQNERKKRFMDFGLSSLMLFFSPMLIWRFKNKTLFIKNLFSVVLGKCSFVGYCLNEISDSAYLPKIRPGLLYPTDEFEVIDAQMIDKLNLIYARDYNLWKDITILSKAWSKLDRQITLQAFVQKEF